MHQGPGCRRGRRGLRVTLRTSVHILLKIKWFQCHEYAQEKEAPAVARSPLSARLPVLPSAHVGRVSFTNRNDKVDQ